MRKKVIEKRERDRERASVLTHPHQNDPLSLTCFERTAVDKVVALTFSNFVFIKQQLA
jgi:hypothetical protein